MVFKTKRRSRCPWCQSMKRFIDDIKYRNNPGARPAETMRVPTFNANMLSPCWGDNTPWDLLFKVPFPLLDYAREDFINRAEMIDFIADGMPRVGRVDEEGNTMRPPQIAFMQRAVERHTYQFAWGNILMPGLCTQCGACWLDSGGHLHFFWPPPLDRDKLSHPRLRAAAEFNVFGTSLSEGSHFYGCVIVISRNLERCHVVIMDPLGNTSIPPYFRESFVNVAANILQMKKGASGIVHDAQIKVVVVRHPDYLTQTLDEETGDSACSFWAVVLVSHWIMKFRDHLSKDPDSFTKFLEDTFVGSRGTYDFVKVNSTATEFDRDISMESVRLHALLMAQYFAQLDDLRTVGLSQSPPTPFKELIESGSVPALQMLYDRRRNRLYSEYRGAGLGGAKEHYQALGRQYREQVAASRTKEDLKVYLRRLSNVDLIRICISDIQRKSDIESYTFETCTQEYDRGRYTDDVTKLKRYTQMCEYQVVTNNAYEDYISARRPPPSSKKPVVIVLDT